MKLKPLADRVVVKLVEAEETRSPKWLRSWPSAPAAWWTARRSP